MKNRPEFAGTRFDRSEDTVIRPDGRFPLRGTEPQEIELFQIHGLISQLLRSGQSFYQRDSRIIWCAIEYCKDKGLRYILDPVGRPGLLTLTLLDHPNFKELAQPKSS